MSCILSQLTPYIDLSLQGHPGRAVRQDPLRRRAHHLAEADEARGDRREVAALQVPRLQDERAQGHALHHRPLHQLRAAHSAAVRQAGGALDQARHGAALPARRLDCFKLFIDLMAPWQQWSRLNGLNRVTFLTSECGWLLLFLFNPLC